MKKVLIITYYWPPAGGPGVQRWLKFCKYLRDFGWEPEVLTVANGSYPNIDKSLEEDIPDGLVVHRTKTSEPFSIYNRISGKKPKESSVGLIGIEGNPSYFQKASMYIRANYFIPDARKGWKRSAVPYAKKLLAEGGYHALISSGPPHSTHLIGLALKETFGIPWLVDLRDPWTNIYLNEMLPRTQKTIEKDKKLEGIILEKADYISVVGPSMAHEFKNSAKSIVTLYNGYDPSDIEERKPTVTPTFNLSYVGNLISYQNVRLLWETLAELKREVPSFEELFRISFTGNLHQSVVDDLHVFDLMPQVEINNFIPHKEATALMVKSNLLLFIVPDALSRKCIITGKLFEYLASGAPILAIGPLDGDAAAILNATNRGQMLAYDNRAAIKKTILDLYTTWLDIRTLEIGPVHDLEQYSRKALTGKLAACLDKMEGEKQGS